MGFSYRKRIRTGKNTWLNVSKRGVSGSVRMGPFTFNSRGRTSVRLGNGLSYRTGGSSKSGGCAVVMLVPVATMVAIAALVVR